MDEVNLRYSYGIVTDVEKWYFLHCEEGDNEIGYQTPIIVKWKTSRYLDDVKTMLEHILWLLSKNEGSGGQNRKNFGILMFLQLRLGDNRVVNRI